MEPEKPKVISNKDQLPDQTTGTNSVTGEQKKEEVETKKVILPISPSGGCDGDCADPGVGGACIVELTPRKSRVIQVSIRVV